MLYRFLLVQIFYFISPKTFAADNFVIGALGDSISTGFNAQRFGDNREYSWSTGSAAGFISHKKRIEQSSGLPVISYNEAIVGSIAADLDRQISRLLRRKPDYVTITIGANDLCRWGDDYENNRILFEKTLRLALNRLVSSNSNIKIVLAAIPNLYNLWEVSSTQSRCYDIWEKLAICTPLLNRSISDEQRQRFLTRWEDANFTLKQTAESYPEHVRFQSAIADIRFEWQHVSPKDCFHPSVAGQNLLSAMAW